MHACDLSGPKRPTGPGDANASHLRYRTGMSEQSVPAIMAPPRLRDNPWTRSKLGLVGMVFLTLMMVLCLGTLPWTLNPRAEAIKVGWFNEGETKAAFLPPFGLRPAADEARNLNQLVPIEVIEALAIEHELSQDDVLRTIDGPIGASLREHWPTKGDRLHYSLGTDPLGRSLLARLLAGGGISLSIGIAAAALSVFIGTMYGAIAGYIGGKVDATMMRIVDVLYGLPYILLVVLLAIAMSALVEEYEAKARQRVGWVDRTIRDMARVELGRRATADDLAAFKERSPQEFAPNLVARMHEGMVVSWKHAVRMSKKIEKQRAEAIRKAKTEKAREEAESIPVPIVPESPPTVEEAEAAVAACTTIDEAVNTAGRYRFPPRKLDSELKRALDLGALLIAIGAVSWLTLARVVRGQVLSLKGQPFVEAARALGAPGHRIFFRHLLPNLLGPIIVYATLTVPQAILQESFLSFLGIGVQPPMPSWGTLAADGLVELNRHRSHWWLLLFPCVLLGLTLLALNFVGEGLREAFDPKRARK